ncbi:MAG TPA: hypothetical protein VEI01_14400 [Terriglobales bacterium]|nr:hypothetical protein [Terriglobales bacterium]HXY50641.1 hypothetical protein [Terriglobales bacterium]
MADYLAVARRALASLSATPNLKGRQPSPTETKPGPYLDLPEPGNAPAWTARYERIFGPGKHHRLLTYIGRRVSCPAGNGTLVNVFVNRCDVDLGDVTPDGQRRVRLYKPNEVEPIQ